MVANPTQHQLSDLQTSVQHFTILWENCKANPADLNQLYSLIGEMLHSITSISHYLSTTADNNN